MTLIWKKKKKNHRIQQQPPPPPPPQAASPQISTPFSFSTHQIRAFHLAWFSLFSNFVSTFSIPPLLPLIRSDLHLSPSDVSSVVAASFAGSILSRLAIGPLCQLLGPATATDSLSFLTVPAIFAASLISSPNSFLAVNGGDSRNDRQRRNSWSCLNIASVVFWVQILNTNQHFSHGDYDDRLRYHCHFNLLPSSTIRYHQGFKSSRH
ncbi:High affinity nitrate transporter 2.7 [Linum perenne]